MSRKYVRRAVGRKRILNITSVKHADHMLQANKSDPLNPAVTLAPHFMTSTAGTRHIFGWVCTARDNTNLPGVPAGPFDKSSRTSTTCFMRGLKEKILIESETNAPFVWRRILFTFTGQEILADQASTDVATMFAEVAPQGYVRTTTAIQNGTTFPTPFLRANLVGILFRGVENIDWSDVIDAPVDTTRVKLLYDSKMNINSGNDVGVLKRFSRWHPFNKNLVYNDDENAGGRNASFLSANSRSSMGDVYVIDIFALSTGAENNVAFSAQASLYWHERG